MWLNRPKGENKPTKMRWQGIMLNKKRVFCTITAIFLSGLFALGVGVFDVPSLLADAIGSSQLAESLGVSQGTRAGAATIRQKSYEFDLEPDRSPNVGTNRAGPPDITLENSALPAWSTETVDSDGGENSLAFDGSGSPAICYVTSGGGASPAGELLLLC